MGVTPVGLKSPGPERGLPISPHPPQGWPQGQGEVTPTYTDLPCLKPRCPHTHVTGELRESGLTAHGNTFLRSLPSHGVHVVFSSSEAAINAALS